MFSLFSVVDYNGLVCVFEFGELRRLSANTAVPEAVNLSEAWRFLAGPPPGNDNLMNVKTNSRSCRVAPWQEMHVCLFTCLLSFTCTCLEGVFWLYASWWRFLSWRAAYARDAVVLPTWGLLWNPRTLFSLRGETDSWGSPGDIRGCFSVIKLSLYSCDTGRFWFLLLTTCTDRWHKSTVHAYLVTSVVLFSPGFQSSSLQLLLLTWYC